MATTTGTEENKRIARQVPEEIATAGNVDLIDEVYAADAVEHDAFAEYRGRAAIREWLEDVREAFPDVSAAVEDVVAEGDTVAMRVTLRGTHEGEFAGIAPTGKAFEVGNTVFTRIEDGRIVERWVQPDALGLLRQLGVGELPAE